MRICLPIIAVIVVICLRLGSIDVGSASASGGIMMHPPLPPELLSAIYGACAAGDDVGNGNAPATFEEICNFRPPGECPSSELP